jgi:hypothetical protein
MSVWSGEFFANVFKGGVFVFLGVKNKKVKKKIKTIITKNVQINRFIF